MVIPLCPHCKAERTLMRNGQATGSVPEFAHSNGSIENCIDLLHIGYSKTIRCAGCNKIRRDVVWPI